MLIITTIFSRSYYVITWLLLMYTSILLTFSNINNLGPPAFTGQPEDF
jgi:hypothetical protein